MAASKLDPALEPLSMRPEQIASAVLEAGLDPLSGEQCGRLAVYLELLLKWNEKLNLTSIRDAPGIISRHIVESIECARALPSQIGTLLDYGSGAGFPGVPCAICMPGARWTFAESQGKKAAFLREVVRILGLEAVVHAARVADILESVHYDAVTLRAVDGMREACLEACSRLKPGGWLAILTTEQSFPSLSSALVDLRWEKPCPLAGSSQRVLLLGRYSQVGDEASSS